MLRLVTAGESHGAAVTVILDGLPAGIPVNRERLDGELARRQMGYGRGGRMRIERDVAEVLSGVRFGATLGSPVAILIRNRDHANWGEAMSAWGPPPPTLKPVTCPRPGHADLAGAAKFGHTDLRDVLERASARETAGRVAAGALVKMLLRELGIWVGSEVLSIGGVEAGPGELTGPDNAAGLAAYDDWQARVDGSPVRCACPEASDRMVSRIDEAARDGYSLGGVFVVRTNRLPPGLGSYTQWDRRLDAALAAALMSIPGVKAVEVGDGFRVAELRGDQAHDEIFMSGGGRLARETNRAGGLEGGVTNGEPLVLRCAMKPIATQSRPLATVDLAAGCPAAAHRERADTVAVPSAAVVGEAMAAVALGGAVLAKLGGDSLGEIRANLASYLRTPVASLLAPPEGADRQ